jgi:outer membrane protein OmpA-like peptidoglycan-associated protein
MQMKSSLHTALIISAIAMLGLTACDQTGFLAEAGSSVDEGSFGQPTMINTMAMTEGDAVVAVGRRFDAEVTSTVTFAFNRSDLSAQAMATLDEQANWIRQFPEVRFRVYGHTDLVGSNAYNYALGLRRAKTVVAYLASHGISTARLEALVSFGETQPVIHTSSPEQRNRRTVTEVSGFTKGSAGTLNGKYAAVIFREYVEGATRRHPGNTAIVTQTDPGAGQ